MAKPQIRPGPFARVFINFWASIRREVNVPKGELIGKDPYGNKYFEIPADPR